jgi:hypothetical protein
MSNPIPAIPAIAAKESTQKESDWVGFEGSCLSAGCNLSDVANNTESTAP